MRGRPEFYVRVMCPPYTAEDAEFLAERNKVLEVAVYRIAAENFELREDNRNLKESYRYLSTTRIEEKKELKEQSEKSILYRTTVGVTQWVIYWLNAAVKAGNWLIGEKRRQAAEAASNPFPTGHAPEIRISQIYDGVVSVLEKEPAANVVPRPAPKWPICQNCGRPMV